MRELFQSVSRLSVIVLNFSTRGEINVKWFLFSFPVISIPFSWCLRPTLLYVFRTKPVSALNSEPLHLTLQAKLAMSEAVFLTKDSPRFLVLVDNLTARYRCAWLEDVSLRKKLK
jgi:hypothetical protein